MRAAILKKYGLSKEAFSIEELPMPEIGDHQLLIESEGFGLNYADVMARKGLYAAAPKPPSVIGYETVGKVVDCGKNADKSLLGKRVTAFCRFGGYAEYVAVPSEAVQQISSDMDLGKALALVTQYATAYYAVHYSGKLHRRDCILVHAACGGVGLAIIQMAKQADCRILAMAGNDKKLDYLRSIGIDDVFNYRKGDYLPWVEKTIGVKKLDSSFNSVAGSTFKKDFKLLGPGGRLILFGAAERSSSSGPFAIPFLLWKMGILLPIQFMVNSVGITGVNMLKIGDHTPNILKACLQEVFELYEQKKIDPVVDSVFDVQQIALAHNRLESRLSIGKVAVKW